MTQVKTATIAVAKNGTENTKTPKTDPPTVPILPKKEKQAEPGMTFDDTQHRLNQLWDLQSKYNRLQTSKLKLKEFNISNAQSEDYSLAITKGYREFDFVTKNPELIKEVVKYLAGVIDTKIADLEKQIRW